MPSIPVIDTLLYATRAIDALLVAALLSYYDHVYRRHHLRLWCGSFLALAAFLAIVAILTGPEFVEPLPSALQVLLLFAATSFGLVQFALALAGTWEALRIRAKQRIEVPSTVLVVAAAVVGGILVTAIFADIGHDPIDTTATMLTWYLAGGLSFAWIAVALWRQRRTARLGVRLAACAMALYAIEMLHVAVLLGSGWQPGSPVVLVVYIGVLDLITDLFVGFGLIIWLLDEQHRRAERADKHLKRLRDFDPVTGFPNRNRLLKDLGTLLRQSNQHTAILLLRLDQADAVSGALGPVAFEAMMADACARMEQHARPGWPRAARLSDNRLVQPIARVSNTSEVTAIANALLTSMRLPFYVDGREMSFSASVGISMAPEDADDANHLIAAAESAAQSAHEQGGNRFQFSSSEVHSLALTRLGLQNDLRKALLQGEMQLYYQPLIAAGSHRICGAEGLVRWNHPVRGLLLPDMFVFEMEQLGLLEELDRHVLEMGCREACLWRECYGSEISVSINLSAQSVQRTRFADLVRSVLRTTGLEPVRLELEVVETGAIQDPERAVASLERLRAIGVRVSLDDFGTGYSPLSYLRELPIDCIKIDRSFVENVLDSPRDAAIVAATITLAHSLGLEVVAEGIESAAQLAWFREQQVDRVQGHYFSPPIDAEAMRKLLDEREDELADAPGAGSSVE